MPSENVILFKYIYIGLFVTSAIFLYMYACAHVCFVLFSLSRVDRKETVRDLCCDVNTEKLAEGC